MFCCGISVRVGQVLAVLVFATTTGLAGGGAAPLFIFRFSGGEERVETAPGGGFERHIDFEIETVSDPLEPAESGAQGWSFSFAGDGVEVTAFTFDGTAAASVDDKPPGLRNGGFATHGMGDEGSGDCEGLLGVAGGVVLSFAIPITLPIDRRIVVGKVFIEGRGPEEVGQVENAALRFVDGCTGDG